MATKKAEAEKVYFNIGENWEVDNVRVLDFGTFFTLRLDGLTLYNLRVVPGGKNYDTFIASPEEKGRDGKYYKLFNLYLDDDDTEEIIAAVEKASKRKKK